MELILLKDVENLGHKGDVIQVRDGYARNFLLPRNLGLAATRSNQQFVADQRARAEKRNTQRRLSAGEQAKKLEKVKITLEAAAGEQNKLFGSITAEDIREALKAEGFVLDKRRIQLKKPIRDLGTHTVAVEVFAQVRANLTVEVVRKASS